MKTNNENSDEHEKNIWDDKRFSKLMSDPRFKKLPIVEKKVKIDKRFKSMFNDEKFKLKYTVDKYGRKLNQSTSEDLKKYYDIESSDEDEEERERELEEKEILRNDVEEENDELNDDDIVLSDDIKTRLLDSKIDYARGEGRLLTDSSSDEESSNEGEDEVFIEHVWGELDREAPRTEQSTRRLAVCNMDWDRIRAVDIMVLCNSFVPPGGSILSIKIYPSEFGKQRMAEEDVKGPIELVDNSDKRNSKQDDSDSNCEDNLVKEQDSDAEEGDEYHMEKLRQYQLNRLKYYYAVLECDSVATADKLYEECDGMEYESTATKLDLRFIPDDVTFDEDVPKDVCTEMPDLSNYKPRIFTNTALQQVKVDLTWDEMDVERKELNEKIAAGKLNEISEAELKKYIACSDEDRESESDGNEENNEKERESSSLSNEETNENEEDSKKSKNVISKYKSLLEEINKKEEEAKKNKYELEYTWGINVGSNKIKNDKVKKDLTPIEKIIEKRKEKRRKRKEEIKRKQKSREDSQNDYSSDDISDEIDMNDPYFAEEFANGDFEDNSKSKSKKSKKKNKKEETNIDEDEVKELELLLDDGLDTNRKHFSLKKIQDAENEKKMKKRQKKLKKSEINQSNEIDNFEVNVDDERFKAIYSSHLFNIDPSDSHFKKTKGMERLIQEKLKRRCQNSDNYEKEQEEITTKRPKKKLENALLIKNIKRSIHKNIKNQ